MIPEAIDVTGQGPYRGYVTYPRSFAGRSDRAALVINAKTIIAAWLAECGRPAAWPLGTPSIDERDLAGIAEALAWSRSDYEAIVEETKRLMSTPAFGRPYEALCAALRHTPYLNKADIKSVLGIRHKAAHSVHDPMEAVRQLERRWQDQQARAYIQEYAL